MTRVPVRLLPSLVLLYLWVGAALAETLQETEALVWLQKIASAARQLNYAGTFVYQHADRIETSRIVHFVNPAGGEFENDGAADVPTRTRHEYRLTGKVEILVYRHAWPSLLCICQRAHRRCRKRLHPGKLQLASPTRLHGLTTTTPDGVRIRLWPGTPSGAAHACDGAQL